MTWGFYQCEPDVWIAIAVHNNIQDYSLQASVHRPNGTGLISILRVNDTYHITAFLFILK